MPALGVTGGIATGKSAFSAALRRHLPIVLFDADQCAHELLARDPAVRSAVASLFGPEIYDQSGMPDRGRLREIVFSNSLKRRQLEQILHPAIRTRWIEQAREEAARDSWFCADIPLLYETEAQSHFGAVIVVACSPAIQRLRLLKNRGLSPDIAETMMAAQFDLARKMAKADYLIWNDSTEASLDRQARLLAAALRQRFSS